MLLSGKTDNDGRCEQYRQATKRPASKQELSQIEAGRLKS